MFWVRLCQPAASAVPDTAWCHDIMLGGLRSCLGAPVVLLAGTRGLPPQSGVTKPYYPTGAPFWSRSDVSVSAKKEV